MQQLDNVVFTSEKYKPYFSFWKQFLENGIESFNFRQVSGINQDAQSGEFITESFLMDDELTDKILKLVDGKDQGVLVVLLAATGIVISKYAEQKNVIISTPTYGVTNKEKAYVSKVPIIIEFDEDSTLREVLKSVQKRIGDFYKYQNFPLSLIDYAATSQGDIYGSNVLMTYEGLHDTNAIQSDLNIAIKQTEGSISVEIKINPQAFDALFLANFNRHLHQVIANLDKLDTPLSTIFLTPDQEQRDKISGFNSRTNLVPVQSTLVDSFEQQVKQTHDRIALEFNGNEITYDALNKQANKFANYIRSEYNLENEDLIGLMLEKSSDMIVAILGILKAGCAYVPIDPEYPDERKSYFLEDFQAKLLITHSEYLFSLPNFNGAIMAMDIQMSNVEERDEKNLLLDIDPSQAAYVIYTSGSTGRPKGVLVPHNGSLNMVAAQMAEFEMTANDVTLQFASISFDASVSEIFKTLLSGAKLLMVDKNVTKDPERLIQFMSDHNVSVVTFPPSFLNVLDIDQLDFLRMIISAGEAANIRHAKEFSKHGVFYNAYGPSECSVCVSVEKYDNAVSALSIGRPISNLEVNLISSKGQLSPLGLPGEICVSGKGVAKGYLNDPELTSEKFIKKDGELFYKTGDMGRWLPDGRLEFLGRKDDQVKVRGYRVELGEIEKAILKSDEVTKAVCVIYNNDGKQENQIVAYYSAETDIRSSELKKFLEASLPNYMVPAYIIKVETFHYLPSGKVNRNALPDVSETTFDVDFVEPTTELEKKLAVVWADNLNKSRVGVTDNYFAIGGDSIKAIRLAVEINKQIESKVEVNDIFSHSTIQELIKNVVDEKRDHSEHEVADAEKQLVEFKENILGEFSFNKPEEIEDIIPMGDLQKGMIFHSLIGADEGLYKEQMYFQIKDASFDQEVFKKAVNLLIAKHPILRTSFLIEDDITAQVIYKYQYSDNSLYYEDISSKGTEEQKEYIENFLREDKYKLVNLERDQLWKIVTFKLDDSEYGILFSCNHALVDGWSNASMMTELSQAYFSCKEDENFQLSEIKASYRDYIKEQIVVGNSERVRTFWRNELDGYSKLPLPFNKSTDTGSNGVSNFTFNIPAKLGSDVVALSETGVATTKHIFLSAFCFLLRFTTGENDITLGLVTNSRPQIEDGDKIIGTFTNTVPFRTNVVSEPADGFVANIDKKAKQLKQVDKLSLIEIMNMVHEETTSGNPIFDIIFNYVDFHIYEKVHAKSEVSDGIIDEQPRGNTNTLFDFTVCKSDRQNDDFIVNLNYRTGLYNQEEIDRFFDYYTRVLEQLLYAGKEHLNPLAILNNDELAKIHSVNDKAVEVEFDNIIEAFKNQVQSIPDAIALRYNNDVYTYAALDAESDKLAHYLLDNYTVDVGQPIGVMMDRSALTLISILSILKAGGVYVPISVSYPEERKNSILSDTDIEVLITDSDQMFAVMEYYNGQIFAIDIQFEQLEEMEKISVRSSANDPAYIMYTSGSTGKPKGVVVSHSNVVNLSKNHNFISFTGPEKVLQTGAISFDATTFEYWSTLLNGGELHILSDEGLRDVNTMKSYMAEQKITTMWFTASWFNQLVDHDIDIFKPLKHLLVGGDKLSPNHISKVKGEYPELEIINGYGPTETTTFAICHTISKVSDSAIPIGKPIQNAKVYLLDKELFLVPQGVTGEIFIGGSGLSEGYWKQPELTRERFLELEVGAQKSKFYKTGDFGQLLPDMTIGFSGRKDNQVKLRGYRVELGEIEQTLLSLDAVEETRVLVKNQESGNGQLLAYITSSEQLSNEKLSDDLKKLLPDYMCPEYIFCLDKFPITLNGKIDFDRLPTPANDLKKVERLVKPVNDIQETMVKVWENVLGREISIADNFFMVGGDSIKAIQVSSRLQKEGYVVEVKDIFTYPTIEELSAETKKTKKEVNQEPVTGSVLLTPIQKEFFSVERNDSTHFNQAVLLKPNIELSLEALKTVFNKLIAHHDMLRATYKSNDGNVLQGIESITSEFDITHYDFSNLGDPVKAMEDVCQQEQRAINLENGPLFKVGFFELKESTRLLIVIHHLVIDGVSWRILLEDMETLIKQYNLGDDLTLPLKTDAYQTWAKELNAYATSEKLEKEAGYWKEVLAKEVDTIDLLEANNENQIKDARLDTIELDEATTSAFLGEAHKAFNTKPNDLLLAAIGLACNKVFGVDNLLVNLEGHGREGIIENVDINRTIGWFTSIFPVVLSELNHDNLSMSIKNVKENLNTIPHKGVGFGILKYLNKDFTKDFVKFRPQVSFNYLGQFDAEIGNTSFEFAEESTGDAVNPEEARQFVLDITGLVLDGKLKFNISYNPGHLKEKTVNDFESALKRITTEVIKHCVEQEEELTPSDLTHKGISMDQLDAINQMID